MHVCMYVCMCGAMRHLSEKEVSKWGAAAAAAADPRRDAMRCAAVYALRCMHIRERMYVCMYVCMYACMYTPLRYMCGWVVHSGRTRRAPYAARVCKQRKHRAQLSPTLQTGKRAGKAARVEEREKERKRERESVVGRAGARLARQTATASGVRARARDASRKEDDIRASGAEGGDDEGRGLEIEWLHLLYNTVVGEGG
ncbi:hypothetical protein IWX48DRAFT_624561 [Phyllosticta citricarpa]